MFSSIVGFLNEKGRTIGPTRFYFNSALFFFKKSISLPYLKAVSESLASNASNRSAGILPVFVLS